MSHEFFEAIRESNWTLAIEILASADDLHPVTCPSDSLPAWLVEMNAPPHVVTECQRLLAKPAEIEADRFNLLELCVSLAYTHSHAFPTFAALLSDGSNPNKIVCGGETLLQHLIGLNRVREVAELLRYGVNPDQMNVFGRESTSNREGARAAQNDAGRLALARFAE
jgi:hypothetical protein